MSRGEAYGAGREALRRAPRAPVRAAELVARRDFPGLDNDPDCLKPVYASWEAWLKAKQSPPVSG